jgi:hypothetical protein
LIHDTGVIARALAAGAAAAIIAAFRVAVASR